MAKKSVPKDSTNYKKIGFALIVAPFTIIFFILMAYALMNTLLQTGGDSYAVGSITSFGHLANYILGMLGILSILALVICIPLGVVYLFKEDAPLKKFDKRSGNFSQSIVPEEIKGWNWGAAGLPIIWGLYHSVWITLLNFVPGINYCWWIVMGIYGNEWAWRKSRWESVAAFQASQNKWKPWGMLLLLGPIVLFLFFFLVMPFIFMFTQGR